MSKMHDNLQYQKKNGLMKEVNDKRVFSWEGQRNEY